MPPVSSFTPKALPSLILALIPASFLAVLVTAARNMWGRSRSLVKP